MVLIVCGAVVCCAFRLRRVGARSRASDYARAIGSDHRGHNGAGRDDIGCINGSVHNCIVAAPETTGDPVRTKNIILNGLSLEYRLKVETNQWHQYENQYGTVVTFDAAEKKIQWISTSEEGLKKMRENHPASELTIAVLRHKADDFLKQYNDMQYFTLRGEPSYLPIGFYMDYAQYFQGVPCANSISISMNLYGDIINYSGSIDPSIYLEFKETYDGVSWERMEAKLRAEVEKQEKKEFDEFKIANRFLIIKDNKPAVCYAYSIQYKGNNYLSEPKEMTILLS